MVWRLEVDCARHTVTHKHTHALLYNVLTVSGVLFGHSPCEKESVRNMTAVTEVWCSDVEMCIIARFTSSLKLVVKPYSCRLSLAFSIFL